MKIVVGAPPGPLGAPTRESEARGTRPPPQAPVAVAAPPLVTMVAAGVARAMASGHSGRREKARENMAISGARAGAVPRVLELTVLALVPRAGARG